MDNSFKVATGMKQLMLESLLDSFDKDTLMTKTYYGVNGNVTGAEENADGTITVFAMAGSTPIKYRYHKNGIIDILWE